MKGSQLWRLLRGVVSVVALVVLAICASAVWFARPGPLPQGDVILVFGAGVAADGRLDEASRLRVATGVALWQAGAAPKILFSGGPGAPGGPSGGARMAALAEASGVDAAALLIEEQAFSTLQNAYFSAQMLPEGTRVIAVTEGFHMARAILSARWAGLEVSGRAVSTRFRGGTVAGPRMVLREGAAWGFNLVRVAVFEIGGWTDVDEAQRVQALR